MPRKITELLYCLLLLLLPFAYCDQIIDPVLMPRQLLLSVFMMALLALVWVKKPLLHFLDWKDPLQLAIGGYFVASLLAFTTQPFTSESHAILSKQLLLMGFLLLTIALLRGKSIGQRAIVVSVMGFGFIAMGSVTVQLIQKSIVGGQHLFRQIEILNGLFANKNLLASILFLCLPFFLIGLQYAKKLRAVGVFGIASIIFILLILRTRTVLAAVVFFVLLLLCFYLKRRFSIRKSYFVIAGFLLVTIGTAVVLNTQTNPDPKKGLSVSQQYFNRVLESKTLQSRVQFWENAVEMFKDHPVFGVGYGNWQVQFPKYGLEKFSENGIVNGNETLQRAHNDFLQVLCESGLVGFLAYCLIFGISIYRLLYLVRKAESAAAQSKFVYLLGGICGFMVISIVDFPMERIEHQLLLMLLLALSTQAYRDQKTAGSLAPSNSKPMLLALFVVALYAGNVAAFRFKGEYETVKLYQAKQRAQWDDVIFYGKKAESRFYQVDPTSIPIDWYMGNAYYGRGELAESIARFENAKRLAPFQIQVLNNLATAYMTAGQKEKAEPLYLEALRISPQFEEARLNLCGLYYNSKDFSRAFKVIDQMDVNTQNKKYQAYLVPILAKEINAILVRNGNPELSRKVAVQITTSQQITELYRASKQKKLSFEAYVLQFR